MVEGKIYISDDDWGKIYKLSHMEKIMLEECY